jgi:uncharacterized DUF497 family protein
LGNLEKHGVKESEVRECLAGVHLRLRNPSGARGTYLAVGGAAGGRLIELVFEDRGEYWWVFHAMPARPRLVRLFRKRRRRYGL